MQTTSRAGDLLREALVEKIRLNPHYSHRAAARDLGISHTYLSLILAGKKKLPFKRAVMFAQLLRLDDSSTQLLLRAAAIETTRDSHCKEFLRASLSGQDSADTDAYAILELDRFKMLSDWYHIAILDLTLLKSFRPQFDWVAGALGITPAEAKHAVERLERLGLLEVMPNGKWRKTNAKLIVPTHYSDHAIRNFHTQMIEKAREALQSPDPKDFASREISGVTIAVNPAKLPEAKKMIRKFHRTLIDFLAQGEASELYQCNFQLFRLTREPLGPDAAPKHSRSNKR